MTRSGESMTLQAMDAPALGVEELATRRPGAGAGHARPTPDPEVVATPKRRMFSAYRLGFWRRQELAQPLGGGPA